MNIGNVLARLAAEGASTGNVTARMCSGCAFKKGTPANGEQEAAENALEALLTDNVQFNCHQQRDQLCAGYLLAKEADES